MFKHKINTKSGITLIALVVTIIVLLLLAGISIQMLTGDNGILQRAGEAKKEQEMAQLKEHAELIKHTLLIDKLGKNPKRSELINAILADSYFEGSTKKGINAIATSDEKYDIIIDNKLNIQVAMHQSDEITEKLEAGLYDEETMDLKISWEELTKSGGPIIVQDGIVSTHPNFSTRTNSSADILNGQLVFPDTITGLADGAFAFCVNLKGSLKLPENLENIGDAAFCECSRINRRFNNSK